jgi:hypothetical protein
MCQILCGTLKNIPVFFFILKLNFIYPSEFWVHRYVPLYTDIIPFVIHIFIQLNCYEILILNNVDSCLDDLQ